MLGLPSQRHTRLAHSKTRAHPHSGNTPASAKVSGQKVGDDNEQAEPTQAVAEEASGSEEKKDGDEDKKDEDDKAQEEQKEDAVKQEGADDAASSTVESAAVKLKAHPQRSINKIWRTYDPQYLGKVTRILPEITAPIVKPHGQQKYSQNASASYEEARVQCQKDVQKIIDECYAHNEKYTDVHFDLESDLKVTRKRDCIDGLVQDEDDKDRPCDVKRVTDLYENPQFFSQGAGFDDIIQGGLGDCWLMSAFSILTCREELINRVCVARDQDVGVYGFVFFRDGEWHPTIIDDKLYLSSMSFDEDANNWLYQWGKQQEQKYIELFQRGSRALYFAKCRDENETWVPLLEKAFAKAHGGYDALRGGQTGEAIEDLTGGVTTEIYTTNILSKDKFWSNEMMKIGKEFLFDATDPVYREWVGWDEQDKNVSKVRKERRKGVVDRHAYAVLDTYEGYGERLVKVRNPWGSQEWNGKWSDGSSQWTAEWLTRLNHQFGDDGVFWMSYKDFLQTYKHINRTRIFDESWFTAQQWASLQVPFSTLDYQQTKFQVIVPEETETVIILSQLDDRYFTGLQGKYDYRLQFRLSNSEDEDEYIARSRPNYELERSTNIERKLKPGTYTILVKVEASDMDRAPPEAVIKANLPKRKEKITTIGRLYDLAHQKGVQMPAVEDAAKPTTVEEGTQTDKSETEEKKSVVAEAVATDEAGADKDSDSDSDDETEKVPWNASCVVGLRVYSKLQDLSVKVIWPPAPKQPVVTPAKDRDDITKSAEVEADKTAAIAKVDAEAERKDEAAVDGAVAQGATNGVTGEPDAIAKSDFATEAEKEKPADMADDTTKHASASGTNEQAKVEEETTSERVTESKVEPANDTMPQANTLKHEEEESKK